MKKLQAKTMRGEKGFTLVELAVVMIIIGLLIGGILKGQEMIANAQVSATVAQSKGIDAAFSTFRDMYDAVPGDIANPDTRLPNCATIGVNCDTGGNGNSRVDTDDIDDAPSALTAENVQFWMHLAVADLLTGIDSSGTGGIVWGQALPSTELGGGYTVGFFGGGASPTGGGGTLRGGHYLTISADPTVDPGANDSGALTSSQAARIDRKMDDGNPDSGSVQAGEDGAAPTTCIDAGLYNEAEDAVACVIHMRIQG